MTLKMNVTLALLIVLLALVALALASTAWVAMPDMAFSLEAIDLAALSGGNISPMGDCVGATTCTGT